MNARSDPTQTTTSKAFNMINIKNKHGFSL